jgi:cell division protein ZapE
MLDEVQIEIQKSLKNLALKIEKRSQKNLWQKIFFKKDKLHSFYIYGDVGRGKTMLMREFFHSIHLRKKSYFHFNVFMNSIHEALRDIRLQKIKPADELIAAVNKVVGKSRVICFDEFQVNDVADAMLLSRIFSYIFSNEVVVIFTSNSAPNHLYQNGLQRELFLEFVNKVLLKNCKILHLDSQIDYRSKFSRSLTRRYFSDKKDCPELKLILKNFLEKDNLKASTLNVWGRELKIKRSTKRIAIFTFDELCRENLSASDYRVISKNFDLIFLLNLYSMSKEDVNEARRLTSFIDEIYENNVALIILSKCEVEEIYSNLTNVSWSKRSTSRLNEIKSDHYWINSKILKN